MTCEPTPRERAMAESNGQEQIWTAERQFDAMPRWLRWSGLSMVMGSTAWAIYQALVMRDHQTLRLPTVRHYEGLAFELTRRQLETLTGLDKRSVTRHSRGLLDGAYLSRYREGRSGKPSWYEINRDLLVQIYYYVGPILTPQFGGIRSLGVHEIPEGGIVIYGMSSAHPLIVEGGVLHAWRLGSQQAGDALPARPRHDDLTAIVENFVERHLDREST